MEVGRRFAYRERTHTPGDLVHPVEVVKEGLPRSQKARIRWLDGEYKGLEEWVPKVRLVRVSDTGEGIAPDHLSHVFERFYRADRSRSREGGGAGLGLAISKALVEAMGGEIWAESEGPGRGAAFSFTLSAAPPET